jgi:hypothetical protein
MCEIKSIPGPFSFLEFPIMVLAYNSWKEWEPAVTSE